MYVSHKGGTQRIPCSSRSGVISCRMSCETKAAVDKLAQKEKIIVSHVIRAFLEESVRRGNLHWWREDVAGDEDALEELRVEEGEYVTQSA